MYGVGVRPADLAPAEDGSPVQADASLPFAWSRKIDRRSAYPWSGRIFNRHDSELPLQKKMRRGCLQFPRRFFYFTASKLDTVKLLGLDHAIDRWMLRVIARYLWRNYRVSLLTAALLALGILLLLYFGRAV